MEFLILELTAPRWPARRRLLADFVAESAYRRRGTAGAFFLKPSIVTRWIVRATYARLY